MKNFLLPSSDALTPKVPELLDKLGLSWTRGVFLQDSHKRFIRF